MNKTIKMTRPHCPYEATISVNTSGATSTVEKPKAEAKVSPSPKKPNASLHHLLQYVESCVAAENGLEAPTVPKPPTLSKSAKKRQKQKLQKAAKSEQVPSSAVSSMEQFHTPLEAVEAEVVNDEAGALDEDVLKYIREPFTLKKKDPVPRGPPVRRVLSPSTLERIDFAIKVGTDLLLTVK